MFLFPFLKSGLMSPVVPYCRTAPALPAGPPLPNEVLSGISPDSAMLKKTSRREYQNPEGLFTRLLKTDPKIR